MRSSSTNLTAPVVSGSTLMLTCLAMLAFASNSLLCRLALKHAAIDAASFTVLRIASGAVLLWLLLGLRKPAGELKGSWSGAFILCLYAVTFSFAYTQLDTGTGALLLFGAVQLTMLLHGFVRGERLHLWASGGLLLALVGLIALLLPGASAPPVGNALLMLFSGLAWGGYSLLGRGAEDPLAATAGNFVRSIPLVMLASLPFIPQLRWDSVGAAYAVLSGAIASGVGYAIWYSAMRGLASLQAATVQLSVPILASLAGILLLGEALTLRMVLSSVAVLGGIALVLGTRR